MRPWIAIIALLLPGLLAAQQIYRYVDEAGNVVFTDEPRQGAEAVELGPINTVNTPEPAAKSSGRQPEKQDAQVATYKTARLIGPPDGSVLREQNGFDVSLKLDPPLNTGQGDQALLTLNGQEYERGTRTSWQVRDLDRGSYSVQAAVVGPGGKRLASSNTLTVTIKKTSALQPRGPSVPGGAPSSGGFSSSGGGASGGTGSGSVSGASGGAGAGSGGGAP
jgi:hypothetical protein